MFKLKDNVEVNFGVIKDYQIAERIGIKPETLSRILRRKKSCSKAIANYIVYLNELNRRIPYNDKHILKYFELERE